MLPASCRVYFMLLAGCVAGSGPASGGADVEVSPVPDVAGSSDTTRLDSEPADTGEPDAEDSADRPDATMETVTDTAPGDSEDAAIEVIAECPCDDGNPCTIDSCEPDGGCAIEVVRGCDAAAPPTEPIYVGVWQPGSSARRVVRDQRWDELTATWDTWSDEGWRLIDIEARVQGSVAYYDALFEERAGGHALYVTSDPAEFDAQRETWSNLGLIDYEVYRLGATRVEVGVWLGGGDYELHRDLTWDELLATRADREAAGQRMVDLEIDEDGDETRYSVLMRPGAGASYLWVGPRWDAFASKVAEIDDLRLVDIEVYGGGDQPRYAGVWRGNESDDRLEGGQPWTRFSALDEEHRERGRRLADIERFDGLPVAPVAWAAEIHQRVHETTVGYSYALAHDGVILGYGGDGHARATWERSGAGTRYTPHQRSHLASISKVITASALMISGVDFDRPFHDLLADDYPEAGAGVGEVTIRDLVTHRSGMDTLGLEGKRCGPDFGATVASLIAADVLEPPGAYRYANTNFCLARAVLEAHTGADYVTWVNDNMFHPLGIYELSAKPDISRPTLYYRNDGGGIPEIDGFVWTTNYTAEAGAYGWYASSTGLVRWLIGLRNHSLLEPAATEALFDENLGWLDRDTSRGNASWHNGGWVTGDGRGLKTCVARLPDGYDAVILMNTTPNNALGALVGAFEALTSAAP